MNRNALYGLGLLGVGMITTGLILLRRKEEVVPTPEPELPPMPPIPEPGLASLYGIVTDAYTGAPLSGVKVTIAYVFGSTFTDRSGWYGFNDVDPETYLITFEKAGYDFLSVVTSIVEGQNKLNVQMTPTLEGVALFSMPSVADVQIGVGTYDSVQRETVQFSIPVINKGLAAGIAEVRWEISPEDAYDQYNGSLRSNIPPRETRIVRTGTIPVYNSYRNVFVRFWGDWAWTGENYEASRGIYVAPIISI